jgi:hypothetical protein
LVALEGSWLLRPPALPCPPTQAPDSHCLLRPLAPEDLGCCGCPFSLSLCSACLCLTHIFVCCAPCARGSGHAAGCLLFLVCLFLPAPDLTPCSCAGALEWVLAAAAHPWSASSASVSDSDVRTATRTPRAPVLMLHRPHRRLHCPHCRLLSASSPFFCP